MKKYVHELLEFIREQGVVAVGVGLVMGVAIKDFVDAIVNNLVDPILVKITGGGSVLAAKYLTIGGIQLKTGAVTLAAIKFLSLIAVIYFGLRLFGLDKLTKKPDKKKD